MRAISLQNYGCVFSLVRLALRSEKAMRIIRWHEGSLILYFICDGFVCIGQML